MTETPRPPVLEKFARFVRENPYMARDIGGDAALAEIDRLQDEVEQAQFETGWVPEEHQRAVKAIQASESLPENHYPSFQERVWWKAALAEIARLQEERNEIEQKSMEWCHAYQRLVEVVTGYDIGDDILKEAQP